MSKPKHVHENRIADDVCRAQFPKKRRKVNLLPHIALQLSAQKNPLIFSTFKSSTKQITTKVAPIESLESVILHVEKERNIDINICDMEIPALASEFHKNCLVKQKIKLIKKRYIHPAKEDFNLVLFEHSDFENNSASYNVVHNNITLENNGKQIRHLKKSHFKYDFSDIDNSYEIIYMHQLPNERCAVFKYKKSYSSPYYILDHSDVELLVMDGEFEIWINQGKFKMEKFDSVYLLSGWKFGYSTSNGGALRVNMKNNDVKYMNKCVEQAKLDFVTSN